MARGALLPYAEHLEGLVPRRERARGSAAQHLLPHGEGGGGGGRGRRAGEAAAEQGAAEGLGDGLARAPVACLPEGHWARAGGEAGDAALAVYRARGAEEAQTLVARGGGGGVGGDHEESGGAHD
jgi:ATP-dependent RNA helicase RhlE